MLWILERHSELIHLSVNLQSARFDISSAFSGNEGGNSRVPSSELILPP
jgi:hypothetical protein